MIGSAEDVHESIDKAAKMKENMIGILLYVLQIYQVFLEIK